MDIYVVVQGGIIVAASTRLQGAELIRTAEAKRLAATADWCTEAERPGLEAFYYSNSRIATVELRDLED